MAGFFVFIIFIGWVFSYALDRPDILVIAAGFAIISSFASYWWSDKLALAMTKAHLVEHDKNPELYHIVENLCITAGLPVPKIYIIPEMQANAFATGRNAKHSVIALTQGLLNKLDKSELEGVVAHELSHIGNKDMLLSTIAVTMAGIIAVASDIFLRASLFGGRSRDDDNRGNAGAVLAVLGIVAVILAPIAASLIQLAISRKREFLADASGALLTRYPEGLARALEKISSDSTPMRTANNATSHLFISSPFKGRQAQNWITKLFMTHPPIEERINALRGMEV